MLQCKGLQLEWGLCAENPYCYMGFNIRAQVSRFILNFNRFIDLFCKQQQNIMSEIINKGIPVADSEFGI